MCNNYHSSSAGIMPGHRPQEGCATERLTPSNIHFSQFGENLRKENMREAGGSHKFSEGLLDD